MTSALPALLPLLRVQTTHTSHTCLQLRKSRNWPMPVAVAIQALDAETKYMACEERGLSRCPFKMTQLITRTVGAVRPGLCLQHPCLIQASCSQFFSNQDEPQPAAAAQQSPVRILLVLLLLCTCFDQRTWKRVGLPCSCLSFQHPSK